MSAIRRLQAEARLASRLLRQPSAFLAVVMHLGIMLLRKGLSSYIRMLPLALLLLDVCELKAVSLEERLSTAQTQVMRAVPAPEQVGKVPELLAMAKYFEAAGANSRAGAALNVATIYALLGGDIRQAILIADRAAHLCSVANDQLCLGRAMNQSGIALWRMNDPYAAMQRLDRAARSFREAGDIERAAIARLNSANIRYDIGDLVGSLKDYETIDRLYGNARRLNQVRCR